MTAADSTETRLDTVISVQICNELQNKIKAELVWLLTLSMTTSVPSPLQAATPCSEEGKPDRSFHLGGLRQLGLKDLSSCAPRGDGRGSSHHSAQAPVHKR